MSDHFRYLLPIRHNPEERSAFVRIVGMLRAGDTRRAAVEVVRLTRALLSPFDPEDRCGHAELRVEVERMARASADVVPGAVARVTGEEWDTLVAKARAEVAAGHAVASLAERLHHDLDATATAAVEGYDLETPEALIYDYKPTHAAVALALCARLVAEIAPPPPTPAGTDGSARTAPRRARTRTVGGAPTPPAPKTRTHTLDADVRAVLERATVDGNAVTLPPDRLAPKFYRRVAEALEAAGARWDRRAQRHVFVRDDAREAFVRMLAEGTFTTASDLAFFATPAHLARELVLAAGVRRGQRVLEPSAGEGAIVAELLAVGAEVVAVEYDARRAATLRARFPGVTVHEGDFLAMTPERLGRFDAVAMNPPFALAGQPHADVEHVTHALAFAPGGMIAAIMAPGWRFRQSATCEAFRGCVEALRGEVIENAAGAFEDTSIATVTVVLRARGSAATVTTSTGARTRQMELGL